MSRGRDKSRTYAFHRIRKFFFSHILKLLGLRVQIFEYFFSVLTGTTMFSVVQYAVHHNSTKVIRYLVGELGLDLPAIDQDPRNPGPSLMDIVRTPEMFNELESAGLRVNTGFRILELHMGNTDNAFVKFLLEEKGPDIFGDFYDYSRLGDFYKRPEWVPEDNNTESIRDGARYLR